MTLLMGLLGLMIGGDLAQLLASADANRFGVQSGEQRIEFLDERTRLYSLVVRVTSFFLIAVSSVRLLTAGEAYFANRFRDLSVDLNDAQSAERSKNTDFNFEYVYVPPASRGFFRDSLIAFEDFARMKGYSSKVSISTNGDSKLGVRFDIESREVEADRASVQIDIEDYVNRLFAGSDFSDLPVVIAPKDHAKLSMSIQKRMEVLRLEIENKHMAEKQKIYKDLVTGVLSLRSAVTETLAPSQLIPKIEIHNHSIGSQDMTTKITATNSPGAVLANKSKIKTGDITIDVNDKDATSPILADLDDLVSLLANSDIQDREKYVAHLELLREELAGEEETSPGMVAKLLEKVKGILGVVDQGTDLYDKVTGLIEKATC